MMISIKSMGFALSVFIWTSFFITSANQAHAQSRTVVGKVVNENGNPLMGVSILVNNTKVGVVTNKTGDFTLSDLKIQDTLVFSYIGYNTLKRVWTANTPMLVKMELSVKNMEELVVIGYGTVKKSDLTGSISNIKAEEINAYPAGNVMQALSGRAAGLQVKTNSGSPGGAVSVRIRGTNSIQGGNEPLYVVDGFPLNGSPLMLNNNDIQSIEVLKDASSVAIYGSRGANGVVLITTKSGKEGRMTVDYESSFGTQQLRKKLDLMNAKEYALFYNLQRANDGMSPYFTPEQINSFGEGFDWQNLVYQKAPIQSHSLNISGGNSRTQFSISGTIFDQEGIIKGSEYKRYAIRTNINHEISEKFKANFSSTLSRNITSKRDSEGGRFGASLISASLVSPPTLTPYNDDGSYRVLSTAYPFVSEGLTNPLNFINEINDKSIANKVLANGSIAYEPIQGLVFKVQGGIETSDDRNDYYRTLNFFNSQGEASVSTNQFISLLNENTISYTKSFNKHSIAGVAGFTYQDFNNTSLNASGKGFLSNATESYNLGASQIPGIPGSGYAKSVLLSYLGRLNYSFDNRILATVSFRSDGSSKYSEGKKWGFFPSAALAWKLKQESFLINNSVISDLKIRASWGKTGSQAIGAYATLAQLLAGKTVFGDALYNTFAPGTTLPGELRWETTTQTDIGVDVAFLQNRLRLTADFYNKNTNDLLNIVQLPSSMGFTSTIQNIGEIQNRGVEFSAEGKLMEGNFNWNLNGNIAFNKSKVVKLFGGQDILGSRIDMLIFADDATLLREGKPLSVFYGYQEDGYDNNGKVIYKDLNGDGAINLNDKTIIGDPNPKFIYSLNSSMSYKGVDLTVFFQGSYGNDLVNVSSVGNTLHYGYGNNMLKEVFYDNWTPENTDAKYPKISRSQSLLFSDRFVESGSFLRLKHVEVGYTLPTESLHLPWLKTARIFVSGQNLLTFTKYSWWDPEVNSLGGSNSISQGIDFSTFPSSKSYILGVKIGF